MTGSSTSRGAAVPVRAGFIPLVDCAPLVVAERHGFAAGEGLRLELVRETSWATLRDHLAVRRLDVAHMLAPVPIADRVGITPVRAGLVAPMALGLGGNTVTVSNGLARELQAAGCGLDLDPAAAAAAFAAVVAERRTRRSALPVLAVVHPHSAHFYQLTYWLMSAGVVPLRDVELVMQPPSAMPAALASGQIDGFCAGEPWGTVAAAEGAARVLTTSARIWQAAPEKVLGMREDWAAAHPDRTDALVRAVYRAAQWCDEPGNATALARTLAAASVLDMDEGRIRASLDLRKPRPGTDAEAGGGFLAFAAGAASFPWLSHALWFYSQMRRWRQIEHSPAHQDAARSAYRPDIYRRALAPLGVPIPTASSKLEGTLDAATPVASTSGRMFLGPDRFFDGRVFDPERLEHYLASLPGAPAA